MKRTYDANIGGTVFHVDEDAYARLDAYLKSIAKYFASFPDAADITTDIEGRIAEQLMQESGPSRIVTITAIEHVITTMGSAEQFVEADLEASPSPPQTGRRWQRQLYRDIDGRIIAGVASGLAAFMNVNPYVIRLFFVLMLIPSMALRVLSILIYLGMWAFIPVAKTTTESLRMRGRAVTLSSVEQKVRERLVSIEHNTRNGAATIVTAIGSLIRRFVIVAAQATGVALILAAIVGVIACTVILVTTLVNSHVQPFGEEFTEFLKTLGKGTYPFIICSYTLAIIPLVAVATLTARVLSARYQIRMRWNLALFAVWFASLLILAGIGASHFPNSETELRKQCTVATDSTLTCPINFGT